MNELDEIKNRIQNRRNDSQETFLNENEFYNFNKKPNKIYKIIMFTLIIMALFLSVAVYAKKDENGVFLQEKLGININFTSFNKTLNKLINFRAVNTIINHDAPVSNVPSYIHMGNDIYVNGGSDVKSIDDGVVTFITSNENGYLVIVENDSGFRSVYSNLTDISVKVNDRIYFESVIGIVDSEVNIIFSKENVKITYEQVLQLLD